MMFHFYYIWFNGLQSGLNFELIIPLPINIFFIFLMMIKKS